MNYQKNDYAINKESKDIVYQSVTGEVITITKAQFLSENPDLTEDDFIRLKSFSDENYRIRCNADNSANKHGRQYSDSAGARKSVECSTVCREDSKALQNQFSRLYMAVDTCLSETQKRRFKLRYFQKLTIRQVATAENACLSSIEESLDVARKKVQKYLQESQPDTRTKPL
jgi:hypothetical protein